MVRQFTKDEEEVIIEAVKLARPNAKDASAMKKALKTFLQTWIEKYPKPGFPDKEEREFQKQQQALIAQANDSAISLFKSLILLDDYYLECIANIFKINPEFAYLVDEEKGKDFYPKSLPYIGGQLVSVLEILAQAFTLLERMTSGYWKGIHSKNIFVSCMALFWEGANPKNKVTSYDGGPFIEFVESLYKVAYPKDKTGSERAIKNYIVQRRKMTANIARYASRAKKPK